MNIDIPTTEDIYKIAFLTLKGWTFNTYGEFWNKPGFVREVEEKTVCHAGCTKTILSENYTTDQAYDAEVSDG